MRQTIFKSMIYLLTILSLFLVACGASGESRASSTARTPSRKPPFNGSMFGKRSFLPVLSRPSYRASINKYGEDYDVSGNPAVENLALEMTRNEPLTRASLDQCIQLQRSLDPEQDPVVTSLCSELIENSRALQENNVWFKQLLGLDRSYK